MTARDLVDVLDEIPGIGSHVAEVIIVEIGLDMSKFPTADHLVSWAKLCPKTIQSLPAMKTSSRGEGSVNHRT